MASKRNALNKPISTQACWRKSDKFHFIYIETFYGSFVLICCRFQRPSFFGDTNECLGQAFWFLLLAFFSRECWVFFLPAYFQAVSHFWVPFLFLGLSLIGAFPIFWFAFFPARFVLAFCHLRSSSFGGFLRQNALSGRNKDIWQKCSRTIFFSGNLPIFWNGSGWRNPRCAFRWGFAELFFLAVSTWATKKKPSYFPLYWLFNRDHSTGLS